MGNTTLDQFIKLGLKKELVSLLETIQQEYKEECYDLYHLYIRFQAGYKPTLSLEEQLALLLRSSIELIRKEAPKWEMIAGRCLVFEMDLTIQKEMEKRNITCFLEKIQYLTKEGFYGDYILEHYSKDEIKELEHYMKKERDHLFPYSGLDLLKKRYLITTKDHALLESVQEMFLGIAMHLAMKEEDRVKWAKAFYDMLSQLKVTMATPTMANARKPYHQLSSCFIDTMPDRLDGIYKTLDHFAQVSKYGGGMGIYLGKVRANGSTIRGFEGAAGGVIRWIKLINDTAIAVDQLGVRQGAVAVYLDAWHKDLPEFLALRTNNGDDRMKAHDVFPALCYPDLFWKKVKENLDGEWHMMCPHEIYTKKGYHLEDYYGEEWEQRYLECVNDASIHKRVICLKDLVRLILKSAVETGTPFAFYRDTVNRANPNKHAGMIYCSNLCTEIAQNMSAVELFEPEIKVIDEEVVVIQKSRPKDFVVCNLASLVLGNLNVEKEKELKDTIYTVVRALDNVIDLNYYPLPYAKLTNQKYRSIGLGVSGYHHMLAKHGLRFDSNEHLAFTETLFEKIQFYTYEASMLLAKEKGSYSCFKGSDYDTGAFYKDKTSENWKSLKKEIQQYGLRNAYLLAIAPTSSTSMIAGTTASIDPIMNKFYLEEKKGSIIARVAPDLNQNTFWLYKEAHKLDQSWLIQAAAIRQKYIDQSQSFNLYITNEFTLRQVLNLYIQAFDAGIKTIYYVRSRSLEIEECDSCSA